MMQRVWRHIDVPVVQVDDEAPKNTRKYDTIVDDDMKQYLQRFYEPHNRRLEVMLGEEWRDAWNYKENNNREQ
jgi:hypothetical protein